MEIYAFSQSDKDDRSVIFGSDVLALLSVRPCLKSTFSEMQIGTERSFIPSFNLSWIHSERIFIRNLIQRYLKRDYSIYVTLRDRDIFEEEALLEEEISFESRS